MNVPLISVVIPAYNSANFISKTLDSVRAQTFNDYEVVVVDDGSSDETRAVVEKYFALNKMPGRCVRQSNKKIAAARNAGINLARGKFIALLDHDDIWYPQKLEKVVDAFNRHADADLVCHDVDMIRNGKFYKVIRCGYSGDIYKNLIFRGNALTPSSSVFRRDKALAIGCFRESPEINTVEDYDFWIRFSKTARFFFLQEALSEYHVVESGASKNIDYHINNTERVVSQHMKEFAGENPSWFLRLMMRRRMSVVYRSAALELLRS
ncbi:MAG: glycosyltransferase, partial [Elusimicrobia bacterium]|nr:glycosyltransferase [Elusimicrobiota bacterium]